jgi:ABC-2 type transport system ATP-binding protein
MEHLRKSFGAVVAVDDLSLRVDRGEVFGLLGPNGAGKSTTIGMAVGLVRPDSGTVDLDGKGSPERAGVRRELGVAPQSLALYDQLTGEENLRLFATLYGLHGSTLRARVAAVLEGVGLTPRKDDRVEGYSGGMKRRLNLAAALVHDPPVVLLDEPTAGVDPQSRNSILEMVAALAGAGKTVIYTTHYMEEAARVCTRVGIIDRGKVLALGTVPELIARHGGTSVVTITRAAGEERRETGDPIREAAAAMQTPGVLGVRIDRPDLESVFLSLTGRSLRE